MSHSLYYNDKTNKYSFFSVREKPWHGVGQIVDGYHNSQEVIKYAGLDYKIERHRLFTYNGDIIINNEIEGIKICEAEVQNYFATIRTDTKEVLGVVGKDYKIVQNHEAFSFFDAIVGGDGIQYETAGALGKGERIFITAKLPSYIKVGRDDLIEKYLFLTTSHDGYGSIMAAFTPIRIVCNNTLNAAIHNLSNSIRIRHTSSAKEKLENAHRLMGISNQLSEQLEQLFNKWAKTNITDDNIKKLIRLAIIPDKEILDGPGSNRIEDIPTHFRNTCDEIFEYAMSNPTQQTVTTRGTLYGAYNAITGYFQNVRPYKNSEAKLKSILLGGSAQIRSQKAFDLCQNFIIEKNNILSIR